MIKIGFFMGGCFQHLSLTLETNCQKLCKKAQLQPFSEIGITPEDVSYLDDFLTILPYLEGWLCNRALKSGSTELKQR